MTKTSPRFCRLIPAPGWDTKSLGSNLNGDVNFIIMSEMERDFQWVQQKLLIAAVVMVAVSLIARHYIRAGYGESGVRFERRFRCRFALGPWCWLGTYDFPLSGYLGAVCRGDFSVDRGAGSAWSWV
jgi:hypothetical protein